MAWYGIALIILGSLVVVDVAFVFLVMHVSLSRLNKNKVDKFAEEFSIYLKPYKAYYEKTLNWYKSILKEIIIINSKIDGIKLVAHFIKNDSHKYVLLLHGYHSDKTGMANFAYEYYNRGYNVIVRDARAHGESEGKFLSMGYLERLDDLAWIDKIIKMDKDAQIIIHGISMGGGTAMMIAGENLPSNVKGIVEDCGYSSVYDILEYELHNLFNLPALPFMWCVRLYYYLFSKQDIRKASSILQLAKCEVPMFFIHGDNDNFVPTKMMEPCYKACKTKKKEMHYIKGAIHGLASYKGKDEYYKLLDKFLAKQIKG